MYMCEIVIACNELRLYENMMKELCIIVWYEELGEKSCFMEKL